MLYSVKSICCSLCLLCLFSEVGSCQGITIPDGPANKFGKFVGEYFESVDSKCSTYSVLAHHSIVVKTRDAKPFLREESVFRIAQLKSIASMRVDQIRFPSNGEIEHRHSLRLGEDLFVAMGVVFPGQPLRAIPVDREPYPLKYWIPELVFAAPEQFTSGFNITRDPFEFYGHVEPISFLPTANGGWKYLFPGVNYLDPNDEFPYVKTVEMEVVGHDHQRLILKAYCCPKSEVGTLTRNLTAESVAHWELEVESWADLQRMDGDFWLPSRIVFHRTPRFTGKDETTEIRFADWKVGDDVDANLFDANKFNGEDLGVSVDFDGFSQTIEEAHRIEQTK